MPAPDVSLVVPAYREGERLPALLDALALEGVGRPSPALELVVVDDGSGTADVEREREATEAASARFEAAGAPHRARFVALDANRGKGGAIRSGWEAAHPEARWLGFLDADGAIAAAEAWRLAELAAGSSDADVLAGSRILMAGRSIRRSLARHLQGRVFASVTEDFFHLGFYDTQCGVKLFRASALRPLLPALREERWLLDVEVLALLRRAGARCREVPIDWADPGGSKMVPGLDAVRMGLGLWRLRRRMSAP